MEYDIFVIYYGNNERNYNRYKSKVKFIEKRKGSKFQNLKYLLEKKPEILENYDYFFIVDDDIIMSTSDINNMFFVADKYKLSICGPAFRPGSKISHGVTKQKSNTLLSYTNFVEVNTPLFDRKSLQNLMKYLDPKLIGWGIDFLYIWCNGIHRKNAYAIVHSVGCINPHERHKGNRRELNLVKGCGNRKENMGRLCEEN